MPLQFSSAPSRIRGGLFTWRGENFREPTVDADFTSNPEMAEDLTMWNAWREGVTRGSAFKSAEQRLHEAEFKAEQERNRPVKGKRMVVTGGCKVKPGYEGTLPTSATGRSFSRPTTSGRTARQTGCG